MNGRIGWMLATLLWGTVHAQGLGYASVAQALEALRARNDVSISDQGGWTIVDERSANTIWSFTPPTHPAHPAVVKRALVKRGDQLTVEMTALCQASKPACDQLIAEFKELNERMAQAVRGQTQAAAAPASDIESESRGAGEFQLTVRTARSRSVDAAQQELLPKARELCGDKSVGLGSYEFELREPLNPKPGERASLVLRQAVQCGAAAAAPAPLVAIGNRDVNWRPSSAQIESVKQRTQAYLEAKQARRFNDAYAMLSVERQRSQSLERWSSMLATTLDRVGEGQGWAVRKITWYKDPPQAAPGIYAAVDIESRFSNASFHCGYLAWREESDGTPRLVREEENFLDKATEQKMKPEDVAKMRAQFGC